MITLSSSELEKRQIYKLLSGSIIPRPIAWITTQNEAGIVNAAPFSFFNVASSNPPLFMISFTGQKHSFQNILKNKEAVVHLVSAENVEDMNATSATLASGQSETEAFKIELTPSQMLSVPSIKEAKARFECELYKHIPLENDAQLVLLRVKAFVFAEELLNFDNFHVNPEKLAPIARLAGNEYAKLGETFELIRPD